MSWWRSQRSTTRGGRDRRGGRWRCEGWANGSRRRGRRTPVAYGPRDPAILGVRRGASGREGEMVRRSTALSGRLVLVGAVIVGWILLGRLVLPGIRWYFRRRSRSEEHTSELQSRQYLV